MDFKPSRQQSGQILHGVEPWRTGCCTKSGEECRHSPRVGRFPWSCYGGEIVRALKDWLNFEHTMFRHCTSSEVFFRWRHQNSFALGFSSLDKQGYCEFSSDRHLFDQCTSYFWNPWACPSFSFLFFIFFLFLLFLSPCIPRNGLILLLRFYSHRHPHRFLKDPINVLPQRRQWHDFSNFWLYLYGSRCRLTMSSYSCCLNPRC